MKGNKNEYKDEIAIYDEIKRIMSIKIPKEKRKSIPNEKAFKLTRIKEMLLSYQGQLNDMCQRHLDGDLLPYDNEKFNITFSFFLHPINHVSALEKNYKKAVKSRQPILETEEQIKNNNGKNHPIGLPYPKS